MFQSTFVPSDPSVRITLLSELSQASREPALAPLLRRAPVDLPARFTRYHAYLSRLPRRLRRLLQRQWRRPLPALALLLALGQAPALAATINVTTSNPNIIADGKCSLIEAIDNANDGAQPHSDCPAGDAGANVIHLPANSTQTLTVVNNFLYGGNGLPVIISMLTLEGHGSTIKRGSAAPEFRIFAIVSSGDLTLNSARISGGTMVGGQGGGIAMYGAGQININNSTVSGNSASYGGGVFNAGKKATINNSTISGNYSFYGGDGVKNARTLIINNSIVSENDWQGVLNYSELTINGSTIAGQDEGVHNEGGTVTVNNSTISGNAWHGIHNNYGGTVIVNNSTISGNNGDGVSNDGYTAALTIKNSTISGNTGGGLIDGAGSVTLSRSVISGNGPATGPQEVITNGSLVANDYNLFGHSGNAGVSGFTPGPTDLVPNKPLSAILAPLGANGGPTKTHLLVKGSPAIDASPNDATCAPKADQRGVPRPQGAKCDIGAVEVTRCETLTPTNGCTVNGVAGRPCRGTAGADTIQGTSGNDIILGLNGNDTLQGLGGNDQLCGGVGKDTLEGGSGIDKLFGGFGGDILRGGGSGDSLFGEQDNDTLNGGSGADKLDGGLGTRDKCVNDADDLPTVGCEL